MNDRSRREPSKGSRALPRWYAASKARRLPTRPLRMTAVAGLCLFVTLIAGARLAHAQGGADGGAPAGGETPSVNPSADGGAAAPAESGGGLFEQSQAAPATTSDLAA